MKNIFLHKLLTLGKARKLALSSLIGAFSILVACMAFVCMTACSDDYADASKPHFYGENENPPLKGSDENMPSASLTMGQANAGTEVKVIDLGDYEDIVQGQLGMTIDEAIAALNSGSVRFLPVNPARRIWDKTPANAGDNKWALSASGIVTDPDKASIVVEFVPDAKEIHFQLTDKATAGIIPVIVGFVKTDDSAYSVNFRCQSLITVTDASVVQSEVTVPKGDYAVSALPLGDFASNIDFAFGVTPYDLAKGLDTENPAYHVYLMDTSGNLYGGPDKYTANGAGYWLTENAEIVNWGADGFALFIEPDIWDYDVEDYYKDGGYFNIGRLSSTAPASGKVINVNVVIKSRAGSGKTLTIMLTLNFE